MSPNPPRRMRIGMFGGSFDPPHWAHRALAETALGQLDLDRLHILPTGHAWHKPRPLSPATHRVAMCRLAFGDLINIVYDEREIHREGPSYTADTLQELRAEYPDADLFLILGADQLVSFKSWVRWDEVLHLASIAVANRAINIGADARLDQAEEMDLSGVDVPYTLLHMPLKNISATAVRAQVSRQAALDVLVPEPVARYISHHHLYEDPA